MNRKKRKPPATSPGAPASGIVIEEPIGDKSSLATAGGKNNAGIRSIKFKV
jgi:hypothetical protein